MWGSVRSPTEDLLCEIPPPNVSWPADVWDDKLVSRALDQYLGYKHGYRRFSAEEREHRFLPAALARTK
jgi:hypothetical protein